MEVVKISYIGPAHMRTVKRQERKRQVRQRMLIRKALSLTAAGAAWIGVAVVLGMIMLSAATQYVEWSQVMGR